MRLGSASLVAITAAAAALYACSSFRSDPIPSAVDEAGVDASADGTNPVGASVTAYAAAVLADRPIAYWRMNIPSGITVPDETHGGHDLALTGSGHGLGVAGATTDPADHAIVFDGERSAATAAKSADFDFSGKKPFTVECWANRAATDGSDNGGDDLQTMVSRTTGSGGNRAGFVLFAIVPLTGTGNTDAQRDRGVGPHTPSAAGGPLQAAGSYHHYLETFDGSNVTLWIDGTAYGAADSTFDVEAITADLFVGVEGAVGKSYFHGSLDEIAIYDVALPSDRIQAHRKAALAP